MRRIKSSTKIIIYALLVYLSLCRVFTAHQKVTAKYAKPKTINVRLNTHRKTRNSWMDKSTNNKSHSYANKILHRSSLERKTSETISNHKTSLPNSTLHHSNLNSRKRREYIHQQNSNYDVKINYNNENKNYDINVKYGNLLQPVKTNNVVSTSKRHNLDVKRRKNNESYLLVNKTGRGKRKADAQFDPFLASQLGPLPEQHPANNIQNRGHTFSNEMLVNALNHNNNGQPSEGGMSGHGNGILRQRLLNALARRIQERNMVMHNQNVLRERNLIESNPLFHQNPALLLDQSNHPPMLLDQSNHPPMLLDQSNHQPIGLDQPTSFNEPSPVDHINTFEQQQNPLIDHSIQDQPFILPHSSQLMENNLDSEPTQLPSSDFNRPQTGDFQRFLPNDRMEDGIQSQRMYGSTVGNLGDEVLPPFGSLGDSKQPDYIPVGRLQGEDPVTNMFRPNQMVPSDDISEFIPNERPIRHRHHHHRGGGGGKNKKTWITDVNVYSKKKKDGDDFNQIFGSDDDDPNDEFVRNHCHPNPCRHGAKCTETINGFKCACGVGFKGERCQDTNYCLPNPCINGGTCAESNSVERFSCACVDNFLGKTCEDRRTSCNPNPCQNHAHCLTSDGSDLFECVCHRGTNGKLCQEGKLDTDNSLESIASIFHVGERTENAEAKSIISHPTQSDLASKYACDANPCINGGSCHLDSTLDRGYTCECDETFSGANCEEKKCKCDNGGTCIGEGIEVKCICKPGYAGSTCQEHTQCNEDTCMHGGICIEQVGGFRCKCDKGYKGQRCEVFDKCLPNPCLHGGMCKDYGDFFKCECKRGFKGKQCEDLDFCQPNPCHDNGQCFGYVGGFQCECLTGFTGKLCDQHLHCLSNPCTNGAECIEVLPTVDKPDSSYKCGCKAGFMGEICDTKDLCHSFPCENGGTCTNSKDDYICTCLDKFRGKQCESINHCFDKPCRNNGKCTSSLHEFKCECSVGFKGLMCGDIDYCQPNPCKNSGFCTSNQNGNGFVCQCSEGYRGVNCDEVDPCFPNPCIHGQCSEEAGGYICNCTEGFKGPQCTEVDHCDPNPCFHGGTCQIINGGVGYMCSCPEGYKGQMCEEKDFCHPNPCAHHSECRELTETLKYQRTMDLNQTDAIECICDKGYRGKHCEDLDQCYPNPCLHDSLCIPQGKLATKCNCSLGWKGEHCELADLCAPDPCRYGTHCIQTDAESYQCVKNLCTPSPCFNGGKCIVVNDESFECACPRGWRGKACKEADACVPNPCNNNGICHDVDKGGFKCECPKNFSGDKCDVEFKKRDQVTNFCSTVPCKNGGSCLAKGGGFNCRCLDGFSGPLCEDNVCEPTPCDNGGTCVPYYGIALCKCNPGFTGAHCSEVKRQPLDMNAFLKQHFYEQSGVSKSFTPHLSEEQAKKNNVNALSLAERMEEILNPEHDLKAANSAESDDLLQDITNKITPSTTANDILPPPPSQTNLLGQSISTTSKHGSPTTSGDVFPTGTDSKEVNKIVDDYIKPAPPIQHSLEQSNAPQQQTSTSPQNITPDQHILSQQGVHLEEMPINQSPQQPLQPQQEALPSAPQSKQQQQQQHQSPITPVSPQALPSQQQQLMSMSEKIAELQSVTTKDACQPNICLNDGACVVRSNGEAECICKEGFSGSRCEFIGVMGYSSAPKFFPNDECSHCDINAICVNGHCICDGNYVGDGLECWLATPFDKDWNCIVNPCQNGGTCKPGRAKCVCKLGYIGTYCETYCPPAVHLSFDGLRENMQEVLVKDESGNNNLALIKNGAVPVKEGGKCDGAVSLNGGDILFDGQSFYPKPYGSVTMAVWVKLETNRGIQSIFDTVGGSRSNHKEGQYHLEIDNGRVRWFHRNEQHVTIFSVLTKPLVNPGNWTHIVGTYNGVMGVAKLFINGDMAGIDSNTSLVSRFLSQDWEGKAGLGKHQHTFGNRLLRGMVDEFYIFDCPLPRLEILVLMHHCKIYWRNNHKKKSDKTKSTPVQTIEPSKPTLQPHIPSANHQKTKEQYQNYFGFNGQTKEIKIKQENSFLNSNLNKPVPNQVSVSGVNRFHIEQPVTIPQHRFIPVEEDPMQQRNRIPDQAMNFKPVIPLGPSALYAELNPLMNPDEQGKRARIMQSYPQEIAKHANVKLQPNPLAKYHHAPVIRNDNKDLPFSPQAYIDFPINPIVPDYNNLNVDVKSMLLDANYDYETTNQKYYNIPNSNGGRKVKISGPSEFLYQLNRDSPPPQMFINSPKPTNHPKQPNQAKQPDPRWFKWQKGLAMVNGGTYTNTHSNTLQRNDPGTAAADTHVQSSQNAKGGTKIKSRASMALPPSLPSYMQDPRWQKWQQSQIKSKQIATQRNKASIKNPSIYNPLSKRPPPAIKPKQPPPIKAALKKLPLPPPKKQPPVTPQQKEYQRQQQEYAKRLAQEKKLHNFNPGPAKNVHPPPLNRAPASSTRNVHETTHTHQWGFGNGNGNGQGIGTPGASGSGGGWGSGGPLTQQVNLPGWEGIPPDGPPWGSPQNPQPPPQPQQRNMMPPYMDFMPHHQAPVDPHSSNIPSKFRQSPPVLRHLGNPHLSQRLPPNARDIWNAYMAAQKRQSDSDMHTDATNIAESSVKINPANGGQNMQVAGHNWGYGNGNGDGNGQGSPGGQGQGGGWGAGGPTKQDTWLPGQQKDSISNRPRIHPPQHLQPSSNMMLVQNKRSEIPDTGHYFSYERAPELPFHQHIISMERPTYNMQPYAAIERQYNTFDLNPYESFVDKRSHIPQHQDYYQQQNFNRPVRTFNNPPLRMLSDSQPSFQQANGNSYKKKKKKKRRSINR